MKKIILTLFVLFLSIVSFSQTTKIETEQDTILSHISDNLDSISDNIVIFSDIVKKDYKELGFEGFVRVYKYFIIIILIFVALTLLWFRNRTGEDDKK